MIKCIRIQREGRTAMQIPMGQQNSVFSYYYFMSFGNHKVIGFCAGMKTASSR